MDKEEYTADEMYEGAIKKAEEFLVENPYLYPLPPRERDPWVGLLKIQEWCIEAAKRDRETCFPSPN